MFKVDDQEISDPKEIVNRFCYYFSNIGPNLATKQIQSTTLRKFSFWSFPSSMFLNLATREEIIGIMFTTYTVTLSWPLFSTHYFMLDPALWTVYPTCTLWVFLSKYSIFIQVRGTEFFVSIIIIQYFPGTRKPIRLTVRRWMSRLKREARTRELHQLNTMLSERNELIAQLMAEKKRLR